MLFVIVSIFDYCLKFLNNRSSLGPEQQQQQQSSHCMRQCSSTKSWTGRVIFPCGTGVGFTVQSTVLFVSVTQTHPLSFLITSFSPQIIKQLSDPCWGFSFFCLGGICSNFYGPTCSQLSPPEMISVTVVVRSATTSCFHCFDLETSSGGNYTSFD